jgi:hypothetical protein
VKTRTRSNRSTPRQEVKRETSTQESKSNRASYTMQAIPGRRLPHGRQEWVPLRINERDLDQLHVNRETQPPVELIEQRCFSA